MLAYSSVFGGAWVLGKLTVQIRYRYVFKWKFHSNFRYKFIFHLLFLSSFSLAPVPFIIFIFSIRAIGGFSSSQSLLLFLLLVRILSSSNFFVVVSRFPDAQSAHHHAHEFCRRENANK